MSPRSRLLSLLLVAACAALGVAPLATAAPTPTAAAAKAHKASRLGGHVRHAWPAKGSKRPKTAIARWLAKQVGPRKPIPCAKRPQRVRAACVARHRKGSASAAVSAHASMRATAARSTKNAATGEKVELVTPSGVSALQLIRSFDIPSDDPSYERLLNWSWTYDSAVAATAFASIGLSDQAGRLLDQLAALQRKDGSIELAFDVLTGESSATVRAGSVAFSLIAFTDYDASFDDARYLDSARRAADYLLSLRNGDGLLRGGPDVDWVSTQHNILAFIGLSNLANRLEQRGDGDGATAYRDAAEGIAKGIETQLLVPGDKEALPHFRQGVKDDVIPLDTQALGVIYALFRENQDLAKQVYEFAQGEFALKDRRISTSNRPATYNLTYEAKGPFTGYRPYLGKNTPNVLWFEGTAEMRFISTFLGEDTKALDESMNAWWDVTRKQGLAPLGADRTITNNAYNEYHVWPTAAAGAWAVLSGAAKDTEWASPPEE